MDNSHKRVRVAILGGGMHGLCILNELKNFGWDDVLLFEKSHFVKSGESNEHVEIESPFSLFNLDDFKFVSSLMSELRVISRYFPESVRRQNFVIPLLQKNFGDNLFYRFAFFLYGQIARHCDINPIRKIQKRQYELFDLVYKKQVQYFLLDDFLIDINSLHLDLYKSCGRHKKNIYEGCEVVKLEPHQDGWYVTYLDKENKQHTLSALYVINALGQEAFRFLRNNGLRAGTVGYSYRRYYRIKGVKRSIPPSVLTQDGLRASLKIIPEKNGEMLLISQDHVTTKDPIHSETIGANSNLRWQLQLQSYFDLNIRDFTVQEVGRSVRAIQLEATKTSSDQGDLRSNYRYTEKRSGRGTLITLFEPSSLTFRSSSKVVCERLFKLFGHEDPHIPSFIDQY